MSWYDDPWRRYERERERRMWDPFYRFEYERDRLQWDPFYRYEKHLERLQWDPMYRYEYERNREMWDPYYRYEREKERESWDPWKRYEKELERRMYDPLERHEYEMEREEGLGPEEGDYLNIDYRTYATVYTALVNVGAFNWLADDGARLGKDSRRDSEGGGAGLLGFLKKILCFFTVCW